MKCRNCGQKYDGNFCPFCGTKKSEEVICEFYPQYNFVYSLIINFFFAFFFVSFLIIVFLETVSLKVFIIILGISLLNSLIINFLQLLICKNIYYKFYYDKLEYCDILLGIKIQTINYDKINQISYKQSEFAKIFNIGKVMINTSNYGMATMVVMNYILNPKESYEKIKKIIEKG